MSHHAASDLELSPGIAVAIEVLFDQSSHVVAIVPATFGVEEPVLALTES